MDCPKCPGKLKELKIGQNDPICIDRCFACGGLWFDKDELDIVVSKEILDTTEFEIEEEPIEDDELKNEVDLDSVECKCPRCIDKKMIKKISTRNKRVIVDYCEKCGGIWLDAGEYNKIKQRTPFEGKLEKIIDFFRFHFPHIFKDSI